MENNIKCKPKRRVNYGMFAFMVLMSSIFGGLGINQFASIKTPNNYTFIAMSEFEYSHTVYDSTRLQKSSTGRTRTEEDYEVTYTGYVDNTKLEYVAINTDSASYAESFIANNPTVNVQIFTDNDDYIVISENDTLESFLENQKTMGIIFATIGGIWFVITLLVLAVKLIRSKSK